MVEQTVVEKQNDVKFERVTQLVREEMERVPVPGVVVGVWHEGKEQIAGFGVTSVEHPLLVNAETLYQIGSITKTMTATAIMRLVEKGTLELDTPARTYLPELILKDEQVAQRVTLRHLLTHTGGWVGDVFDDTGPGDDALAKMVAHLRDVPQLTPLGEIWSYNNAGFYVAGRVIELVTGMTYEAALKELVLEPLGMHHAYLTASEVITHRFAVGHNAKDKRALVARPWALPRCLAPVGGLICDMPDLFRYARFHMGDGTTANGTRLLTPESLSAMQTPLFQAGGFERVGISWFILDVDGTRTFGHGGGTKGQITDLRLVPSRQFALAIFTNGDEGGTLRNIVRRVAFKEYLDIDLPQPTPVDVPPETLQAYVGRYDSAADLFEVRMEQDKLVVQCTEKGGFPTPATPPPPQQPPPMRLAVYGEDRVIVLDDPMKDSLGEFLRRPDGRIAWLRLGGRVHARL